MKNYYSKIKPELLLHLVYRLNDVQGRTNVAPESEYLQLATMKLFEGQTFKAHRHLIIEKTTKIAQESWVVIKGRVKCIFFDLDDQIIAEEVLNAGDCSMTFYGGHNYVILEENTIVYEFKTGPYLGVEFDKTFI